MRDGPSGSACRSAEKRQSLREVRAAVLAKLAGKLAGDDGSDDDELFADDLCDDDPTDASNAVLALIHDGKLDEAEAAARALLAQYPDVHDGWDRLRLGLEKRRGTQPPPRPHQKTRSCPESQNSPRLPPADLTTHDHGP